MSRPLIELKYDVLMKEDDIRALTGGKAVDAYVHITIDVPPFTKCKYAVIEFKGRSIKKALAQLESSVAALRKNNKKIDYAIIMLKRHISKYEQRLFSAEDKKLYQRVGKGERKPIVIDNIPVYVLIEGR